MKIPKDTGRFFSAADHGAIRSACRNQEELDKTIANFMEVKRVVEAADRLSITGFTVQSIQQAKFRVQFKWLGKEYNYVETVSREGIRRQDVRIVDHVTHHAKNVFEHLFNYVSTKERFGVVSRIGNFVHRLISINQQSAWKHQICARVQVAFLEDESIYLEQVEKFSRAETKKIMELSILHFELTDKDVEQVLQKVHVRRVHNT